MSKTRQINGATYHITTNGHARELLGYCELPDTARGEFAYYMGPLDDTNDEHYSPRFFQYRGAWYDSHEFQRSGHDLKALGYDAVQTQSYWDAILTTMDMSMTMAR